MLELVSVKRILELELVPERVQVQALDSARMPSFPVGGWSQERKKPPSAG